MIANNLAHAFDLIFLIIKKTLLSGESLIVKGCANGGTKSKALKRCVESSLIHVWEKETKMVMNVKSQLS